MTPKLWVDYTNHRGERRWREIENAREVYRGLYPPTALPGQQRSTFVMNVKLVDRSERRTLALTSCHGFFEGTEAELQVHTSTAGNELADLNARHEAALVRLVEVGNKNDRRRSEIATLRGQLTEAEDELKEVLHKALTEAEHIEGLHTELKSRDRQLTAGATQYEALKNELAASRKIAEVRAERIDGLRADLKSALRDGSERGETIARLTRALTEAEKGGYTPVIQARVSDLEAQVKALREAGPRGIDTILKATGEMKDALFEIVGDLADRMDESENVLAEAANRLGIPFSTGSKPEPEKAEDKPEAKPEADDCECAACRLRRLLTGVAPTPPITNGAQKTAPEPKGYEATGRNPMYEGHFDDDPAMLAQAKGEITALSENNDASATVGMRLHAAGRLVVMAGRLSLSELRQANTKRQVEWDQDFVLVGSLGAIYRANELAGEVGETCNIVKKLERERLNIPGSRATIEALAEEMADVVISLDLLAMHYGINLGPAVREKFNATSVKMKLETRL